MQRAGESAVIAGPWVKREELDLSGLAEEMRELGSRLSSLVYRGGDVSKFGRIHAGVDRGALNEVWLAGAALAGLLLSFQKAAAGELGMPEGNLDKSGCGGARLGTAWHGKEPARAGAFGKPGLFLFSGGFVE